MPTGDSFSIEPVSFIIAEGVLVSVRFNEFRTFTESAKRLQMNYRAFPTGYHLLISILEVRIDFDADLVEALAKNIAALSKEIDREDAAVSVSASNGTERASRNGVYRQPHQCGGEGVLLR